MNRWRQVIYKFAARGEWKKTEKLERVMMVGLVW